MTFDKITHEVFDRENVINFSLFWMNSAGSMEELDSRLSFELMVGDDIVVEDMTVRCECEEDKVTAPLMYLDSNASP